MDRRLEPTESPEDEEPSLRLASSQALAEWAREEVKKVSEHLSCRVCLIQHTRPVGSVDFSMCVGCPCESKVQPGSSCDTAEFDAADIAVFPLSRDDRYYGQFMVMSEGVENSLIDHSRVNSISEKLVQQLDRLNRDHGSLPQSKSLNQQKILPAENEVKATEERPISKILDHLPGMAYRCSNDKNWTMQVVSAGCAELVGYSPENLIGNRSIAYAELILREDRAEVWTKVQEAVEARVSFELEYRILTAEGVEKTVWDRGRGVFQDHGLLYIEGFITDITSRVQTAARLQRSEQRFRTLYENFNQGVVILDLDGEVLDVNQPALDLLGMAKENLVGASSLWRSLPLIREDGSTYAYEDLPWVRALKVGSLVSDVVVGLATLNRSIVWLNVCAIPEILSQGSKVTRVLITLQDITQHLRKSERLRQLNRAIEQSPVAVMITDLRGRILYVNPEFSEMTGYSTREVIGKNPRFLKSGRHNQSFYDDLWKTILEGRTWNGEIENRRKGGEVYWERASIAGVKDERGQLTHFVALKEDVTEHKNLEKELLRQERLAAVGQLAAGISHDFNNLLTTIIGHADLMQMDSNLSDSQLSYLELIVSQGRRASQLTRQILDFSRQTVREPRTLDLKIFLKEVLQFVQRTISENVRVKIRMASENCLIYADPNQMQQVITNLALNSRDAMPQGGLLTFELSIAKNLPHTCHVEECSHESWVKLQVHDDGQGIAAEHLPRVFEPFFSTKKVGEGTGLGLAQVYGIVHQHNGCIEVESTVGEGTSFSLYFPRALDNHEQGEWESVQIPQGRGETVLLVEDEPSVLGVVRNMLEVLNYRVISASDGIQGLRIFLENQDHIDVILSDVVMPNMGGIELVRELHRQTGEPRIILMSGYPLATQITDEIRRCIAAMIKKPMSLHDLANALQVALVEREASS